MQVGCTVGSHIHGTTCRKPEALSLATHAELQGRRPSCTAALCNPPVVLLARWYTKVVLETSTVLLPVTAMALTTGAELFLHIRVVTDTQLCRWTPQERAKAACS